jgi:hypothetical protein
MEIIQEIGLQVIEILTLLIGMLGLTFSVMLMLSPKLTKNLSNFLNRSINVDEKISFLDKDITLDTFLYNHHIGLGLLLIFASAFTLFFLFFSLDIEKFIKVIIGSQKHAVIFEIIINAFILAGKLTCLIGLLCGLLLIFMPGKMKLWEDKLNSRFETKSMIEKLDKSSHNVDSFFFRHPIGVGLTGAVISFFILSLSIIKLLE